MKNLICLVREKHEWTYVKKKAKGARNIHPAWYCMLCYELIKNNPFAEEEKKIRAIFGKV